MTALAQRPDSATASAASEDHFGAVETAGVEYVPEEARHSRPRNLGAVFLGANLTWTKVSLAGRPFWGENGVAGLSTPFFHGPSRPFRSRALGITP
jgi:hypothetical protein